MKKLVGWAALLGLLVALPVRAQTGAEGVKYTTGTGQRLIGVEGDSTQRLLRTDANGNLKIVDDDRDRDLDFGVTTLITSVAIDSGGVGGANFRTSAPVDVRQYGTGRIIVHITAASAADTVGFYVYGVTLFALTQGASDWTAVGNPITTSASPAATDTLGFKGGLNGITANAIQTFPGERAIVLSTDRTTSNYANINAAQTVSYSWDVWLGAGAHPRYLLAQARLMSKNVAGNLTPSVRIDLEGLR